MPFSEEHVSSGGSDEDLPGASPLAKIPFLRTERGPLCESRAILVYIETAYPEPPLLPSDAVAAAKMRELAIFADLYLELVARDLCPKAFFGGSLSDEDAARIRSVLEENIAAFQAARPLRVRPARRRARQGRRCRPPRPRPRRS